MRRDAATKCAHFRFYAELNDFLPPGRRFRTFTHTFERTPSVKDMIESFGVPHTEVDLILLNGESVDFGRLVDHEDRISVYPVFESVDIAPILRLRPQPLREPRFVADENLGGLARNLRLLGFDTVFARGHSDAEIARTSRSERRTLLTRDVGLLKRRELTHAYFVRSTEPREQVVEVLQRLDLFGAMAPFSRCLTCNGELRPVEKAEIEHRIEPDTKRYFREFQTCSGCNRVYWKGSHYERMTEFVDDVRSAGTEVPL
jgi:uncharacterized protein